MARFRAQRALPAPERDRQGGARHALLHTVPGRLIVIGLAIRLLIIAARAIAQPLPAFFGVVDTVAGLAIAIGAAYFTYRLLVAAKRRLLWRVRRKLILSYIFIGFIPSMLIVAFFLLGGFLLFYNLSSYLLQSRLRALGDEARFLARSTALEIQRAGGGDVDGIVSSRHASVAPQYPASSLAVVPVNRSCATGDGAAGPDATARAAIAGPWAHVDPPQTLPAWIDCAGFGGLLAYAHPAAGGGDETHILVRGVAFPDSPQPRYGVVVDLPVNDEVRRRLRGDTGVELQHVSLMPGADGSGIKALPGRAAGGRHRRPTRRAGEQRAAQLGEPARLSATGRPGRRGC